jgi:hypothetical protein
VFSQKIKNKETGLMLYGITPPKSTVLPDRLQDIADKTIERLKPLKLDGLIVYDIQDEASRTDKERPFPFVTALDPLEYSLNNLSELEVSKIIYRPTGIYTTEEITTWVNNVTTNGFSPVFVGSPSKTSQSITSLTDAYNLWAPFKESASLGGVTIPERHFSRKNEHLNIISKKQKGVEYFVSQCVYNVDLAKEVVFDLIEHANGQESVPTIIFTLTPFGNEKTMKFMEWLGINVPFSVKEEVKKSASILEGSIKHCEKIAQELALFCKEKNIPFGFNIESVAITKAEIEASVQLFHSVEKILKDLQIRT